MSDDTSDTHILAQTTALFETRRERLDIVPGGEQDLARRMLPDLIMVGNTICTFTGQSIEERVQDYKQLGYCPHLFVNAPPVRRQDRLPHSFGKPPEPAPEVIARAKRVVDPRQRHAVLYGDDPTNALNKHSHLSRVWVKK